MRVGSALGNTGALVVVPPEGTELVITASGSVWVIEAEVLVGVAEGITKDDAVRKENWEARTRVVDEEEEEETVMVAVVDAVPVPLIDPDEVVEV
jgi:hypothetical protein